jgi:hypothetical protein
VSRLRSLGRWRSKREARGACRCCGFKTRLDQQQPHWNGASGEMESP